MWLVIRGCKITLHSPINKIKRKKYGVGTKRIPNGTFQGQCSKRLRKKISICMKQGIASWAFEFFNGIENNMND